MQKSSGGLGTKILRWHAKLLHDTALEVNLTDSNLRKKKYHAKIQRGAGDLNLIVASYAIPLYHNTGPLGTGSRRNSTNENEK